MEGLLQGRTFGLPNLVLIGVAAVGVWFLFLRGRATTKTTAAAIAPTGQATTDYSLGYAQGLQAAAPGAGVSSAAGPTQAIVIRGRTDSGPYADYDAVYPGVPVYGPGPPSSSPPPSAPPTFPRPGQIGVAPFNSVLPLAGTGSRSVPLGVQGPQQTGTIGGNPVQGASNGFTTSYWAVQYGPITGYVAANDVAGTTTLSGAGVGGPRRPAGSRSAYEWHDSHPMVGARVPYAHYVRAVGGPANHMREVHRVARQAGVHPARVLMLNPEHTGRIRVA